MATNKEIIIEKYQEMKKVGIAEDFLDKEHFGSLKIFINEKPKVALFSVVIEPDIVYVGSDI